MGQGRYIMAAILILFVGFIILIGAGKINFSKGQKPDVVAIDYDSKNEKVSNQQPEGRALFSNHCASCHAVKMRIVGPALAGVTERGPWKDFKKLCQYIRNPMSLRKDKYIDSLQNEYPFRHQLFPNLTDKQIRQIVDYIDFESKRTSVPIP